MSPAFAIAAGLILLALAGGAYLIERKWPGKLNELAGGIFSRKDSSRKDAS